MKKHHDEAYWRQVFGEQFDDVCAFFQARRDVELGRWRDPRYPDRVVYRRRDLDDVHGRAVCVLDETSVEDVLCWEQLTQDGAARAYFAAHPARRPGCDADPGEGVPGD